MDQDAFRKVLAAGREGSPPRTVVARGSFHRSNSALVLASKQSAASPKSELKPRKLKNAGSNYRDRAAERREGMLDGSNEIEEVREAIGSPLAKGGDTIRRDEAEVLEEPSPIKGLDLTLLEKTKARVANAAEDEDDELLEKAYLGIDSYPVQKKEQRQDMGKKTRADLIRELKEKRAKGSTHNGLDKSLDDAKREGKFKPIGFKPIDSSSSKTNDASGKVTVRKKKKRKLESGAAEDASESVELSEAPRVADAATIMGFSKHDLKSVKTVEPEPSEDDIDIFAGTGEYEGFNFDEEEEESKRDESETQVADRDGTKLTSPSESVRRQKWIEDDEPPSPPKQSSILPPVKGKEKEESEQPIEGVVSAEPEPEQQHLEPLAASYLPSIRDILEADLAIEAEEKRKVRREKRKAGRGGEKKVSAETKLNREYQKLKAYTEKKNAS